MTGYLVRSHENEDLGTIEEFRIDASTGSIAYAVLCFGGLLGFGGKLFAIPWYLLRLNAEDRVLVLDADRTMLETAPAFEQEDWPDFADESWGRAIHDHFGREPYKKYGT